MERTAAMSMTEEEFEIIDKTEVMPPGQKWLSDPLPKISEMYRKKQLFYKIVCCRKA